MTAFRVAQEALTNVARHAEAREVSVVLQEQANELCLRIADDGCGFAVAAARPRRPWAQAWAWSAWPNGCGWQVASSGIKRRAPGEGTTVEACLPLAASKE